MRSRARSTFPPDAESTGGCSWPSHPRRVQRGTAPDSQPPEEAAVPHAAESQREPGARLFLTALELFFSCRGTLSEKGKAAAAVERLVGGERSAAAAAAVVVGGSGSCRKGGSGAGKGEFA